MQDTYTPAEDIRSLISFVRQGRLGIEAWLNQADSLGHGDQELSEVLSQVEAQENETAEELNQKGKAFRAQDASGAFGRLLRASYITGRVGLEALGLLDEAEAEAGEGGPKAAFNRDVVTVLKQALANAISTGQVSGIMTIVGSCRDEDQAEEIRRLAESMPQDVIFCVAGPVKRAVEEGIVRAQDAGKIRISRDADGGVPRVIGGNQIRDIYLITVLLLKVREMLGVKESSDLPLNFRFEGAGREQIASLLMMLPLGFSGIRVGEGPLNLLTPLTRDVVMESLGFAAPAAPGEERQALLDKKDLWKSAPAREEAAEPAAPAGEPAAPAEAEAVYPSESDDDYVTEEELQRLAAAFDDPRYLSGPVRMTTVMGDLVAEHPEAVEVLAAIGMHCIGCASSAMETLGEACRVHGLDPKKVLAAVNMKITG